jgi:hypothetical protein
VLLLSKMSQKDSGGQIFPTFTKLIVSEVRVEVGSEMNPHRLKLVSDLRPLALEVCAITLAH